MDVSTGGLNEGGIAVNNVISKLKMYKNFSSRDRICLRSVALAIHYTTSGFGPAGTTLLGFLSGLE